MLRLILGLLAFGFVLTACTGPTSTSGAGGGGGPGSLGEPKNKDEALARLSTEHRANFEKWQQALVKSCDPAEAFGIGNDRRIEASGIDSTILLAKNNGSVVFADAGQLAVLSKFDEIPGNGNSKTTQEISINGQTYAISAETKREGSNCSLYLYGQKVHSAQILKSVTIGTHYNPGKVATSTSSAPVIRKLSQNGAFEARQHGLFSLISETFRPDKESLKLVAAKLGLTTDEASRLLSIGGGTDYVLRVANDPSSVWSNYEVGNLIASNETLHAIFESAQKSAMEVRLAVSQFNFNEGSNTVDAGGIKATVQLTVAPVTNGISLTTQSVEIQGVVKKDPAEAVQCMTDRANAYGGGTVNANSIQPSVTDLLSPCQFIDSNIEKTSYTNGFFKNLISSIVAGVVPSNQVAFNGWDNVLSILALETLKAGKDLRSELDPNAKAKLIDIAASHLEGLKTEIGKSKNLQAIEENLYKMGLRWSFSGQLVNSGRIAQILSAADNAVVPFQASTLALLRDLADRPTGYYDELLNFALNAIDASYKSEAVRALSLANDLNYNTRFQSDVFDRVIQRQIKLGDFQDWSSKFETIKSEINNYKNIGPVKSTLVDLSIKWLSSKEVQPVDLSAIYSAIDNAVEPFKESVGTLLSDLSKSLSEHRTDLDFARSLTAEYKRLAANILANSKAADFESWGKSFFRNIIQSKNSLEQVKAINEMWIAALAFTTRELARTSSEMGHLNDWSRKHIIETAASEIWSAAEFQGLEVIAPVAKSKNGCDSKNGMSSLAECGGLNLFSKKPGKFFDPTFAGRYMGLATDFTNYLNSMSGFDWTTDRWALVGAFFDSFNPIWSKCDKVAFQAKSESLKFNIAALLATTDSLKKWELEREMKTTLENCR